jgi:DNA-directed RNA polymerase specialized sigma24 family protein
MTNSYLYSIKVNEALQSYGARTHGSLARRVERLKRFTDMKNKQYADEIKLEHARMMANQEREERVQNRIRELKKESAPVFLRRNLRKVSIAEPQQEVEIPTTLTPSRYNLRPRRESAHGLNLLWQAIQNGFVNPNRG